MNTQNFCFVLKQNSHLLREGCFGLEKENVRVNQDGTLALTPHPAVFGDKGKHPYITTDFSESQVEMITPPLPSVGEALGFMETLHDVVTENIGDELLWLRASACIEGESGDTHCTLFGRVQGQGVLPSETCRNLRKGKAAYFGNTLQFLFLGKTDGHSAEKRCVRQLYGGGQGNGIFPCGEELSQIPLAFYLAIW